MSIKKPRTMFNVEFENDDYFAFEKGLSLYQDKHKIKLANYEFAQKAVLAYCAMLISLEKNSEDIDRTER